MEKAVIFDSGALISLGISGLLDILKNLKKITKTKFIITNSVKYEVIDRPLKSKKFELEALRVKSLFDNKILELPGSMNIPEDELNNETRRMLSIANNLYSAWNKNVDIISEGESSCLALSRILSERKIKNVICIDERTTRMLGENPENLRKLIERKTHSNVKLINKNFDIFKDIIFIRSTELAYFAYKKKIIDIPGKDLLDAMLYALKFSGCAISDEEIKQIKRL